MSISDSLLPEFDHEMANTRKLLELIPDDKVNWKPHTKSRTLGQLAMHLGYLPVWVNNILTQFEFDLDSSTTGVHAKNAGGYVRPEFESTEKMIKFFDENVASSRKAIASASDKDMLVKWALKKSGKTIFSFPRISVLRSFVISHSIHHRGQLTVYLRLIDIPLPNIYGATADTEV